MKQLREILGYLLGTLLFVGLMPTLMWLWRPQAWILLALFFAIMRVQVFSEERRLRRDFGDEYEAYCRRVNRVWPWFPRK